MLVPPALEMILLAVICSPNSDPVQNVSFAGSERTGGLVDEKIPVYAEAHDSWKENRPIDIIQAPTNCSPPVHHRVRGALS